MSNELPEHLWPRDCYYQDGNWYTRIHGLRIPYKTAKSAKIEQDVQTLLREEGLK